MKKAWFALAVGLTIALTGCRNMRVVEPEAQPPELSPEQRREMQTRQWDAPMDVVFSAAVDEIQDLGWTLDSVDKASGVIRASTAKRLEALGPEEEKFYDASVLKRKTKGRPDVAWTRWMEAAIHIEPWGNGKTRQRIVLNLRGLVPAMSYLKRQEARGFTRAHDVMVNAPAVEESVEVEFQETYRELFDRVGSGIAQRKANTN